MAPPFKAVTQHPSVRVLTDLVTLDVLATRDSGLMHGYAKNHKPWAAQKNYLLILAG